MDGNLPATTVAQASSSSPVVIAGMHRSGTSLIASLVSSIGVRLGDGLVPPDRYNPRGYFEDTQILALNREMLGAATAADDGGHPDWGWTETGLFERHGFDSFRERAAALVEARDLAAAGSTWGWKDPRTTLALEFWDSIVPFARYVLVYRHPWEVADSMQRLGAEVFLRRPDYAWRIWRFYNTHLLEFHRRHKDRALLVSANATRLNPDRLFELLETRLGLAGSRQNDSIVDPDLFRGVAKDDPLPALAALAHRDSAELLTELDRTADLSGAGLWNQRLSQVRSHQPEKVAPRVSIVIPCYNHGEYLIEAVASVERSVEEPCELILVNDGSDDPRTLEVLDLLGEAGYRVLNQENLGLPAARNSGINEARSPYILPLDADNRLRPGFITAAMAILDAQPEVGVVYGDRWDFGMRDAEVRVPPFDAAALLQCNFIDACALMRKEVWSACGGYDTALPAWEDWDLWIGATECGWQFHHLPGIAFDYRVRPDSMSAVLRNEQFLQISHYVFGKHRSLYSPELLLEAQRAMADLLGRSIQTEKLSPENVSKISLEVSNAPREVHSSALFRLDAKVTNETNETLSSAAPYPVRLACHWIEKTTRRMVVFDGSRSRLSPPLDPNTTGRYPMKIVAPDQPGEYILQTTMVQEDVRWFEDVQPGIVQEFGVSVF
jgi:glycosyltransferase involved in cell wall biosynthesis